MPDRSIVVKPIAGSLGAEVSGVDLAAPLRNSTAAELRRAFVEHLVLFFRDQTLTPEQQLAVSRLFGPLVRMPYGFALAMVACSVRVSLPRALTVSLLIFELATVCPVASSKTRKLADPVQQERVMRSRRYPEFDDHKQDHERLLDEIRDIMDGYELHGRYDAEALSAALGTWFSEHFRTRDARLHAALARPG